MKTLHDTKSWDLKARNLWTYPLRRDNPLCPFFPVARSTPAFTQALVNNESLSTDALVRIYDSGGYESFIQMLLHSYVSYHLGWENV